MKGQVVILGLEIHVLDVNTLRKKKARNSTTLIHSQGNSRTGEELDLCAEKLKKHLQNAIFCALQDKRAPTGQGCSAHHCAHCLPQDKV